MNHPVTEDLLERFRADQALGQLNVVFTHVVMAVKVVFGHKFGQRFVIIQGYCLEKSGPEMLYI